MFSQNTKLPIWIPDRLIQPTKTKKLKQNLKNFTLLLHRRRKTNKKLPHLLRVKLKSSHAQLKVMTSIKKRLDAENMFLIGLLFLPPRQC